MRALCPTLLLGASLAAQAPSLDLHLAADPARQGPEAWTFVRNLLPKLPGWPERRDPFAAVHVQLALPFRLEVRADSGGAGEHYSAATIHIDGCGTLEAYCEFSGLETLRTDRLSAVPGRFWSLIELCSVRADAGPLTVELAALAGNLMAGAVHGDPVSELLTWGAAHCGRVTVLAWHEGTALAIRGQSRGGLLLPAALVLLADWQSHPSTRPWLEGRPVPELERWVLLAASACYDEREEAARQLARFKDPTATAMLERLLLADDDIRLVAMQSLVRAGAASSLPHIVAAASPAVPHSDEVARVALSALWPDASQELRDGLRPVLATHSVPALRAFAHREGERSAQILPAGDGDGGHGTVRTSTARRVIWTALIASALCLCWCLRRARG